MSKEYDYKKAMALIEERKESLESASLGMHEDWFWTADTVFEDGVYKKDLTDPDLIINGINSSCWATPTLQLMYKDGSDDMIECSKGEQDMSLGDKIENQIMWTYGCLSSQVQENITPLSQSKTP